VTLSQGLSTLVLIVALGAQPAQAQSAAKNPRLACGCAAARLLVNGPQDLATTPVAAWLHDGAELLPFQRNSDAPQKLDPIEAPIQVTTFQLPSAAGKTADPAASRLVRASATAPLATGTFLGVVRPRDSAPRDVVVANAAAATASAPSRAPSVAALWLAPLEERERPACGRWLTHRLAFELNEGSSAIEAFVVKDVDQGDEVLIDVRAVGAFGIGRVDVCSQGLPIDPGPIVLEVRPVSASFGVGEPWVFRSDGTGTTDVVRVSMPADANTDRAAAPFPTPGQEQGTATVKELAIVVMGVAVGGAALVALALFVLIPMRKRRMVNIKCPSCHSQVPVDALDPKTDGFFCPSCGAAGFWKGKSGTAVAATPLHSAAPVERSDAATDVPPG
jgi:hypothetical protein